MGKSTLTVRQKIENLRDEMQPFRRAMKPQYQEHYDHLFHNIGYHAMPAKASNRPDSDWLLLFTACIGQQRQLDELEEELQELKQRLEGQ